MNNDIVRSVEQFLTRKRDDVLVNEAAAGKAGSFAKLMTLYKGA